MIKSLLAAFGTRLRFDGRELFAMWLPEDLKRVSEQQLLATRIGYRAEFTIERSVCSLNGGEPLDGVVQICPDGRRTASNYFLTFARRADLRARSGASVHWDDCA